VVKTIYFFMVMAGCTKCRGWSIATHSTTNRPSEDILPYIGD